MAFYFYLVILAAALTGFIVSWYIHHHKHHGKVLVCPLNSDCDKVVNSDYSTFLGLELERWGIGYYGLVVLTYLALIFYPEWGHSSITVVVGFISIFAFIFSLYLTYIQASRLKEWCVLCITSALCCASIFLALMGNWFS